MVDPEKNISRETFDHLVDLAEFKLEEPEAAYLLKEMNAQLGAIDQLAAIDLDEDVQPAARGVSYPKERRQGLREDEPETFGDPESIHRQAPETQDGYVVVPDIPHTTLE